MALIQSKAIAMYFCLLCFTAMFGHYGHAQDVSPNRIVMWDQNYREGHTLEFISLLVEFSKDTYGDVDIVSSDPLEQGRAIKELQKGEWLNLAIMGNDREREALIAPIYYPIDKGALGLRVCLIKKGEQEKFSDVRNAQSARQSKLLFGLGSYWPDTPIFTDNGFKVLSSPVFDDLFSALRRGRFDCLSRGVSEVNQDLARFGEQHYDVEQRLAFVYPLANFIYTANAALRERMEYGLARAKETGELERLAEKHLLEDLTDVNFFGRRLIILQNEKLTERARQAINAHGFISFESAEN